MERPKRIQTARCPECNGIVMMSVYPIDRDKQGKKELVELAEIGCTISVELYDKTNLEWHEIKKCQFKLN